jgi:3'-5' exoribonuclease
MQHTPIDTITPGSTAVTTVIVKQADVKVTGTGKTFVNAIVEDATGRIECIQWGPDDQAIACWTTLDAVEVHAKCGTYKDKPQLTVTGVRGVRDDEVDWGVLLPKSPCTVSWLKNTLEEMIAKIHYSRTNDRNEGLASVIRALTTTPEFICSPAATFMHHAYIHGLLEHSLSVCMNAMRYSGLGEVRSGGWDFDVVVAGALLHDVGKIREYTKTGKRLPASNELGHSLMGCEMLSEASMMENVDPVQIDKIKHVIASHHGRREWGAIVEPQTSEAWLVHCMDLADSRMFTTSKRVS